MNEHGVYWFQSLHLTVWYCDIKHDEREEFVNIIDYRSHIQDYHPQEVRRFDMFARRKRMVGTRDRDVCLLCESTVHQDSPDQTKGHEPLLDHIAAHLRSLAMYSLPKTVRETYIHDVSADGQDVSFSPDCKTTTELDFQVLQSKTKEKLALSDTEDGFETLEPSFTQEVVPDADLETQDTLRHYLEEKIHLQSREDIKPEFWRVQNIKVSEKNAAVEWLLALTKELALPEGQGFTLAADGEQTLCATLTSHERPKPSNSSWRVDKNFIGFTPLSDPDDANVDIFAVTGLGGHALESFRSADGMSVWLRDFAPLDVPRARFITYGYDMAVVASDSNQGVHELARTLLDGLAVFRQRTQTQHRPLLFICHGLGGVVLKYALVMSGKATDAKHKELLEVATMTYGLVFMGVPNLGLKHNQLQTVVEGRPSDVFVKDLLVRSDGEASQFMTYLTSEFSDLDRRRSLPFEIVSYYETVSSPTVVVSMPGRTTM